MSKVWSQFRATQRWPSVKGDSKMNIESEGKQWSAYDNIGPSMSRNEKVVEFIALLVLVVLVWVLWSLSWAYCATHATPAAPCWGIPDLAMPIVRLFF